MTPKPHPRSALKVRPHNLRQIQAECQYGFIYHRDCKGRPAITHCILYHPATNVWCRGFAILSELDIKLGRVSKKLGRLIALGRAWAALQRQTSFGEILRYEAEQVLDTLCDNNLVLETAIYAATTKAQYDISPLPEEREVLASRKVLVNIGNDPSIDYRGINPETGGFFPKRSRYQYRTIEEINKTLRELDKLEHDAKPDPDTTDLHEVKGAFGDPYWKTGPPPAKNPVW